MHIHIAGKSSPILIALLQLFSSFDDIILVAALVLSRLPCMDRGIKFRLDVAILIDLIDADELLTILVKFFDFIESRIEGSLKRPVDVQHTAIFTKLNR